MTGLAIKSDQAAVYAGPDARDAIENVVGLCCSPHGFHRWHFQPTVPPPAESLDDPYGGDTGAGLADATTSHSGNPLKCGASEEHKSNTDL